MSFCFYVRFVCISDTHEKLDEILHLIPDGDVLIHAGDFTECGNVSSVIKFNQQMGTLPHKVKIVVPGNHELGFEDGEEMSERELAGLSMLGINKAYELLTNCIYLCDRQIEVFGLKVYGAPWHPMPGYSFYRQRGQALLQKWNQIPNKVDVYHVFGHIHQQHGCTTNGTTTFINASICDHKLRTEYDPIIFDLALPCEHSKLEEEAAVTVL
uniref:Metallophos domain-containing protein n=1 Tax=Globodera pallida TaxID=36090 RepID=A0A183CHZ3_GLOPA